MVIGVENLYQTQNASAIIRTADCFGIQEIHAIEESASLKLNAGISRGADKWVDVVKYRGTEGRMACINSLRRRGYRIVVTSPHAESHTPENLDISRPLAVFLGNEKWGVSPELFREADAFVRIPMTGFTESLNVSVATGILLHTLTTRMDAEGLWEGLANEDLQEVRERWYRRAVRHSAELLQRMP